MTGREPLYEKYRPRAWSDVLGQEKAVERLMLMRDRGEIAGQAYWVSGQSGTGKTTVARLIAAEIAGEWGIEELDATDLTPARLREIESGWRLTAFGKGGRAYIVNEAHGLRKDAVRQLLVMLERQPRHVAVIFTTTNDGQQSLFEGTEDAGPLLSRCVSVSLSRRGLAELFAARAKEIAEAEGLDGKPVAAYLRLVQQNRNNMRGVLQAIQSGEMKW